MGKASPLATDRLESRLSTTLATAAQARAIIVEAIAKLRELDSGEDICPHGNALDIVGHMLDECMPWDDDTIIERFRESNDAWEEACARADWERDMRV